MRKLLLVLLLASTGLVAQAQSKDLNINASTLNQTITGKWYLLNANPANGAPFQEFTIKGPGFGSIGKVNSEGNGLDQIMCKILIGNADISFNDADGERQIFRVIELTKTSITMSNDKVKLVFGKAK